jgi:hypothetical protein
MVSIRSINPMVRAVGTMGAVAAVVGGITFAALTSNTVALSDNTLSAASATLAIGAGSNCSNTTNTSTAGFNNTKLDPGVASDPVSFCLRNVGDVPLDVTASIPSANLTSATLATDKVTLDLSCTNGAKTETLTATLADLSDATAQALGTDSLAAGTQWDCIVKATLDSGVTTSGSVGPFSINFAGTEPTTTAT